VTFPADVAERLIQIPAEIVQLRISNLDTAENLEAKTAEVETLAEKREADRIQSQGELEVAYITSKAEAEKASLAWQAGIGTPKEGELMKAAATAMSKANTAAQLAGRPIPYDTSDFPEGYR